MKKLLVMSFICIGLLTSPFLHAVSLKQKLQRIWQCRPTSSKADCTAEERAKSKKWLLGGAAAALATALAAVGIAVGVSQMKNEQQAAGQTEPWTKSPVYQAGSLQGKIKEVEDELDNLDKEIETVRQKITKQTPQEVAEQGLGLGVQLQQLKEQKAALELQLQRLHKELLSQPL